MSADHEFTFRAPSGHEYPARYSVDGPPEPDVGIFGYQCSAELLDDDGAPLGADALATLAESEGLSAEALDDALHIAAGEAEDVRTGGAW